MTQHKIRVCNGKHCKLFGADKLMKKVEEHVHLSAGTQNDTIDLAYTDCCGYCSHGPNIRVDDSMIFMADVETVTSEVDACLDGNASEKGQNIIPEITIETIIENDFLGDLK